MKNAKVSFPGTGWFDATTAAIVGGYKGKGNYQIEGRPGLWYIRAASSGWGYIATAV